MLRRLSLTAVGAALAMQALPAYAQQPADAEPVPSRAQRQRRFSLLGLGDFAASGMRTAGQSYWWIGNGSPVPASTPTFYILPQHDQGNFLFEMQLWMASARSDWLKNRDLAPSLENVTGGGWNARMNFQRWMPDYSWAYNGRDGSVGTLHSGAVAESGTGSCLDNSTSRNGQLSANTPLLAASDCPPTWPNPSRGFEGERPVPDTIWLKHFKAEGTAFNFDDWRIPSTERSSEIYGSFQVYGATNDYGREVRDRFGPVIPGGRGRIQMEGYPMGIEWVFQSFSYAVPAVADVMWYKAMVINKSAEVYGVGLDYDSLYLGVMPRPGYSPQTPSVYAVPEKGAIYGNNNNTNNQGCYGSVHGVSTGYRAGTNIRGCNANGTSGRGMQQGPQGMVVLKSPIGDLRNKKFSDPASPFYSPGHPLRGDTLTYNQLNACGFTCGSDQFFKYIARGAFGAYANIGKDALAARGGNAGALDNLQYFDLFHNADFPTRWSQGTGLQGEFNRYIPPTTGAPWTYNRDASHKRNVRSTGPDTMMLTTCENVRGVPGQTGCVKAWTDTLPGGFPNNLHNAYHAGVGPIQLHAGDTTEFTFAFIMARDSTQFERIVNDVIDTYQNFWVSARPPAQPNIVSAEVKGGNRQYDTFIRLYFDQGINTQTDPFLLNQADKLRASTDPSDIRLRMLNPTLINDIRSAALPFGTALTEVVPRPFPTGAAATNAEVVARAAYCRGNLLLPADTLTASGQCQIIKTAAQGVVDTLFIFKSCDGGLTYTNSSSDECTPAPARDVAGQTPGFAWQAYSRLARNTAGNFPATFRDGNVSGGVTYTYVVVAKSRSASFPVLTYGANGAVVQSTFTIRPAVANALTPNTSNRNVAVVYVPASAQAGSKTSAVVLLNAQGGDTVAAYSLGFALSKPVRGTTPVPSQLIFSDSAEIFIFDKDTASNQRPDSTKVILYALADTGVAPATGAAPKRGIFQRDTLVVHDTLPFDVTGIRVVRKDSSYVVTPAQGSTPAVLGKITIYRFGQTSNLPPTATSTARSLQATLVTGGRPIFITDSLPAGTDPRTQAVTPEQTLLRSDYNGLLIAVDVTTARQRTFRTDVWSAPRLGTLSTNAYPSLRWQSALSTARSDVAYSNYEFTFGAREFGPGAPFALNTLNPTALQNKLATSIAARRRVSSTVADDAAAAAINRALNVTNITRDSLAVLGLPFTGVNKRTGKSVQFAVLKRDVFSNILLGNGSDTVRVTVPTDQWLPGEKVYFIEQIKTLPTGNSGRDTIVVNPITGRTDSVTVTRVTWGPAVIGCSVPSAVTGVAGPTNSCNPIEGVGGTGYTAVSPGQQLDVLYYSPIGGRNGGLLTLNFLVAPEKSGNEIRRVTSDQLSRVKVVPNPYVMFSYYEQTNNIKRIAFTQLPPRGRLRIYTASGQLVQELRWTEQDLEKNCGATVSLSLQNQGGAQTCQSTGDLMWDMRTRENLEVGPGFYMFVVSTDVGGKHAEHLGKFVIIH